MNEGTQTPIKGPEGDTDPATQKWREENWADKKTAEAMAEASKYPRDEAIKNEDMLATHYDYGLSYEGRARDYHRRADELEREAAERVIDEKSELMPQSWKDVIYPPPQSQTAKPVAGEKPKNLREKVSGTSATPDKGMQRDLQKGKRVFQDSLGLPADEQGNPVDEHGELIDHEEE